MHLGQRRQQQNKPQQGMMERDNSDDEVASHEDQSALESVKKRKRIFLFGCYYYYCYKNKKKKTFLTGLSAEGGARRNRSLPRFALVDPQMSPWQVLYNSGDDPALITVTGMDHEAFRELLRIYFPHFDNFTPWTGDQDGSTHRRLRHPYSSGKGRKRVIDAEASLGLVLAWHRFRGAEFVLQGWFGFTGTHNGVWLRFGRRMLCKALRRHPLSKVKCPTNDEVVTLKEICVERHAALEDVYCFADGLKLMLEAAPGVDMQGKYCNGWTHDHYITNLFVFSICGRIITAIVNAPGALHDSTLASWGGVYDRLNSMCQATGGICCVDSAFQADNAPYLIKSAQDTARAQTQRDFDIISQATSLRQAAEWGMKSIQSSMPRLKDRFLYEPEEKDHKEREAIMKLVPLLYNFRLEFVGLNQIRNTHVINWSKDGDCIISN